MSSFQYPQAPRPFSPKPSRRSSEEDRAWARLYKDVAHACTAEEVVKHLDQDPEAKRSHLALYLSAKKTLRTQKVIDARNRRVGTFVRSILYILARLVLGPVRLLRSIASNSIDIAVGLLPAARRDPAKVRASALRRSPEFARAAERFTAVSGTPSPMAHSEESRDIAA